MRVSTPSAAAKRGRRCVTRICSSSTGTPGSSTRVPAPARTSCPGAVPTGFSSTSAPSTDVGHAQGDRGKVTAARPEARHQRRLQARVAPDADPERPGRRLAGDVILGRPESAADDHQLRAGQHLGDRGRDRVRVVLDAPLLHERHPARREQARRQQGIGVEAVGAQQLRAHREERRPSERRHGGIVARPRKTGSVVRGPWSVINSGMPDRPDP